MTSMLFGILVHMETSQERLLGCCAKNLEVLRSLEEEAGGTLHPLAGETRQNKQARKLGRCDSYLRNLKLSITH